MPEMTARHLLDLFDRDCEREDVAQVRVDCATFEERRVEIYFARLREDQRRWGVRKP